jgi:hypothetical protein
MKNNTWHPFLFAVAPILSLYEHNKDIVDYDYLIKPLLISIISSIIIFFVVKKITKNKNKSALIVTWLILLFWLFGLFTDVFIWLSPLAILLIWLIIFIAVIALIINSEKKFENFTSYLNFLAIFLILWPLASLSYYEYNKSYNNIDQTIDIELKKNLDVLPDIYYLVFDGYGRQDVLQNVYKYNNDDFINFLKNKGFYIAEQSNANYMQTYLSMASSLNFEYLNYIAEDQKEDSKDRKVLRHILKENKVYNFLKQVGYTFVGLPPTWTGNYKNTKADIYINKKITTNDFDKLIIQTTPLSMFYSSQKHLNEHQERYDFIFEEVGNLSKISEPTFTYVHFLAPHPPFILNQTKEHFDNQNCWLNSYDGNHYFEKCPGIEKYHQSYLAQLDFINQEAKKMIDKIIKQSSVAPIIIIQSDHGPGSQLDLENLTKTNLNERFGIINAYYTPSSTKNILYPSITPVNSFRIIFNDVFGTNFEILEDKNYYSTWSQPYNFIEVTDQLNQSGEIFLDQ